MIRRVTSAVVISLILFLSGCASFDHQAFNREANSGIKSIVVVTPKKVPDYSINILYHPGMSFGLIGELVAAGEMASKATQFEESLKPVPGIDWGNELAGALKEKLSAKAGREISTVVETGRTEPKFLDEYSGISKSGDAYLDAYPLFIGYWANSHSTPYYPAIRVTVRLVNARDKSVLYNGSIMYAITGGGGNAGLKGVTVIPPDHEHSVQDFATLTADPGKSVKGLKAAIHSIAQQIADDLQP